MADLKSFWQLSEKDIFHLLNTHPQGLTRHQAARRLKEARKNSLSQKRKLHPLLLLLSQFNNPLIYILIAVVILSLFFQNRMDAVIILIIIFGSGILSFIQEKKAASAVNELLAIVKSKIEVLRDGKKIEIDSSDVVHGDIIYLSAGDMIPGDCYLLEAKDFHVDESTLTGETFPIEKKVGLASEAARLSDRRNSLFMGTHVVSGSAIAVVVLVGKETEFGKIAEHLRFKPPETSFERGVRHFGYFLLEVTLMLVILIFALNMYFGRAWIESLLFALALAVGLTPQLLPAIITINLSYGAKQMAEKKVIVRKLDSIENFGSMDVLCVDKTGTLTVGSMKLTRSVDCEDKDSSLIALWGYLNASLQTGYTNPIDMALVAQESLEAKKWTKLDEVPFDFVRKRISILAQKDTERLMIVKGAFHQVVECCSLMEKGGKKQKISESFHELNQRFLDYVNQGYRVVAVAYRDMKEATLIDYSDEKELIFCGFLLLSDPPKPGIAQTMAELKQMGISLKMITGDHRQAALHFAQEAGMPSKDIVLGSDLYKMSDSALLHVVNHATIFAEIEPNQKERIIMALKKRGHIVGFLGDGINDVTALHISDVGISVNGAVDVAKDASDIILLNKDLSVLKNGISAGRKTFANTLKYVFMATSANFGNMFSMAGASLFLSFLPLLPKQILLTNLLTDFPEMSIATDRVDTDWVAKPLRWNLHLIRKFMLVFGLISSFFDFLTFFGLLYLFQAGIEEFRTGWFIESVLSATAVVLVIRTEKLFFKSRPSFYLLATVLCVMAFTVYLPFTPLAAFLGFTKIKASYFIMIFAIIIAYVAAVEIAKRWFYASRRKK